MFMLSRFMARLSLGLVKKRKKTPDRATVFLTAVIFSERHDQIRERTFLGARR